MKFWSPNRYWNRKRGGFGITESIVAGSVLADAIGTTAASALVTGGLGAAAGAAGSAITGGNPLTGALTGGISGGFGSLGGAAGLAGGIGSTAGSALGAGAGGALGAAITGSNPLTASLMAGGASLLNSGLNSLDSPSTSGPSGTTAAPSGTPAPGTVAPPSIDGAVAPSPNLAGALSTAPAGGGFVPPSAEGDINFTPSAQSASDLLAQGSGGGVGGATQTSPGVLSQIQDYLFGGGANTPPNNVAGTGTSAGGTTGGANSASQGVLSKIFNSATKNPLTTGLMALQLYNLANKPALPTAAQQQASTQGAGWNTALPQYQFNSKQNPISNYYTYGYSPQPLQIQNTLTPVPGSKKGGIIKKMSMGGVARPRAPMMRAPTVGIKRPSGEGMAALGAISRMKAAQGPNAGALTTLAAGGKIHPTFMGKGQVATGTGTKGQDDKVPALLSEDEYVMPADVTSHLGDGSSTAGGHVLDKFVASVRQHKMSKGAKGLPPKAKSPDQYLRG